uniref:DUF4371 domain-containing protein n=1 Tax=Latimeria chalumnae TaxID=7897 RepID=H2ZZ10_LATCH
MVYFKSTHKMFCFCCKLFDLGPKSSLAETGNSDWKHMAQILQVHETTSNHYTSYQKWVEVEIRIKRHQGSDKKNQQLINKEAKHWTNVLECLMSIVLFLTEHNIAFRGSSECLFSKNNNGNFIGLVQLLGKFDTVMQKHLHRMSTKESADRYCGKTIQNELNLLAKTVKDNIIQGAKESKCFSVTMDCTPDVSHRKQLSFTIHFVDTRECTICVKFHTVQDSTGEGLKEVLMDMLDKCGLNIQECRGQGYDNGTNMKRRNKGVQTQILQINLKAFFMLCSCHSVNHIKGLTLEPIWECRVESLKAVRYQTVDMHDALVTLAESEDCDPAVRHEANTLASQLTDFKFLIAMVVWYDILSQVNVVSKSMQNIATAVIMMEACFKYMISYRKTGYATAVTIAKELATELGVEPVFKHTTQVRRKKHQFDYEGREEAVINPPKKFKKEFFELATRHKRFVQMREHNDFWGFLYNLKKLPDSTSLIKNCKDLHTKLTDSPNSDINGVSLCEELLSIQGLLPHDISKPKEVLHFIPSHKLQDVFSNIWVALIILLTLPV